MSSLSGRTVAVVGGGFGGLSAACYLADAGADVRLLEKNDQLGGRASRLERDGFKFDMGPSWYLMPDVFERFFAYFGHEPADYYDLEHLDPHYRIFFKDGDQIDIRGDREEMRELFESYEEGAGDAFEEYLDTSRTHYETAMEKFVYEDRSRLRDWVDPEVMKAAPIGLQLTGSMQDYVDEYFDNPKLKQIMQYSLVFLGGAPKNTPALYNIMSHVDFNLGVYYPDGGLGAVVDGVVELGEELGVTYETGSEVTSLTKGRDNFIVEVEDGARVLEPDNVVVNADYRHAEQELLPEHERQYDEEYWEERTYAPSAYLLYMGVEGDVEPLEHHTLVLPEDWDPHFEQIFDDPTWPDEPAYYICVPSKTDDSVAPEGHSNLFVLVPIAPGLADGDSIRDQYREKILDDIAEHTGVELHDRTVVEEQFAVSDFVDRYNATEGTALGLAHTLRQTALLRPSNRSSAVDGLYFTGSFTTPGIGVPMCLISGQHAAEALVEDAAAVTQ
ncbi:phytoene desaturase [Halovenus sp. WSH3]|uniref:Phytoene desaturase n=1 Tax=Halovenus carboxidivorans TaxID=2692199 RepID=A0A6B0T7B3_9EURY|nr:phytoene desaturase family protein [Halovenus carboxidivorans]MXR52096.1 phytoene desaturase [Halovenus carboxidivorans]